MCKANERRVCQAIQEMRREERRLGEQEGERRGEKRGVQKGELKKAQESARNFYNLGLEVDKIAPVSYTHLRAHET